MSRIGKQPISIPEGVNIDVKESLVTVKGPKGSVDIDVHKDMVSVSYTHLTLPTICSV